MLDETIVNSLPEELRKDPQFAEVQKGDLPGVFKNLFDSQRTLGRAILLPDEKDPEEKKVEKINSVYDKLGRPKSHSEYDFKDVLPEGFDGSKLERYAKAMHEAGLNSSQAKRIVKEAMAELSEGTLSVEKAVEIMTVGEGDFKGWGD